jgi:hypothetical protein
MAAGRRKRQTPQCIYGSNEKLMALKKIVPAETNRYKVSHLSSVVSSGIKWYQLV